MADPTYYCVQTFRRIGGRLTPSALRHFRNARAAVRAAHELGTAPRGALAYEFTGRPEFNIWGEPRLLAACGDVPEIEA